MLKTLAYVGLAVLLAVGALVVYAAATQPDVFRVERSLVIAAPAEKLHPLINDMKAFNTWNPYNRKDPAMTSRYQGPAAGPGAAYEFEGNGDVGKGSLRIVEPTGPNRVSMKLEMTEPMAASNRIDFTLVPQADNTTRVTWAMQGACPLLGKVMGVIFDMDKMVGTDFDNGLKSLKTLAETR
jgi:uncharacterized protein YndB with AHSA1/START domain